MLKNKVKAIMLVFCFVMALVCTLVISAGAISFSADSVFNDQSKYYQMTKSLSSFSSFTIDAEIYMSNTHDGKSSLNTIIGNRTDKAGGGTNDGNEWSLEIVTNGTLRLYLKKSPIYFCVNNSTGAFEYITANSGTSVNVGSSADLRGYMIKDGNAVFAKISVVVDTELGKAYLYINGALACCAEGSEIEAIIKGKSFPSSTTNPYLRIGNDYRGDDYSFDGDIKNIAMYAEARTLDQHKAYASGASFSPEIANANLLFAYNLLDLATYEKYVLDYSANSNNATYLGYVEKIDGRTFTADDGLAIERRLDKQPLTYSATFKYNSSSEGGVIISNRKNDYTPALGELQILKNGVPQLRISVAQNQYVNVKFENCDVRSDDFVNLAITHEINTDGVAEFKCYLNGVLKDTVIATMSGSGTAVSEDIIRKALFDGINTYSVMKAQDRWQFTVGNNYSAKAENRLPFKGELANLSLYSRALSATEIASAVENGVNLDEASLQVHYDFTAEDNLSGNYVTDSSKNNNGLRPNFEERESAIGEEYAYSFVVIPDTQTLLKYDIYKSDKYNALLADPTNSALLQAYEAIEGDRLSTIFDWIVANKTAKNIKFVMNVGDMAEYKGVDNVSSDGIDQTDLEYEKLVLQYNKLTEAGLLYTVLQGDSHDTVAQISKFFGIGNANYEALVENAGFVSENDSQSKIMGNYYVKITEGETDYLILCMEHTPSSTTLTWADGVIKAHPNHKVIVTTHGYLNPAGELNSSGSSVFESCIKNNENVIMVICGHEPSAHLVYTKTSGNVVHQLLVDFQDMDTELNYETGMVAVLYFTADGSKVKVEYVSTYATLEAQKTNPNSNDILYRQGENSYAFNFDGSEDEGGETPEPDPTPTPDPDTLETPYGTVADSTYLSSEAYPFFVFKKNSNGTYSFNAACTHWGASAGNANSALHKARYAGEGAVIYLRRDFNVESGFVYNNLSNSDVESTVVDLGGKTFTLSSEKAMFPAEMRHTKNKSITVKNGEIVVSTNGIIALDSKDITSNLDYGFKFSFENVDITLAEGATTAAVIMYTNFSDGDPIIYCDIDMNNCNIDTSEATNSNVTLFNMLSGCGKITAKITGGEITSNGKLSFAKTGTSSHSGSSLEFIKGDTGYTVLNAPSLKESTVNGGSLTFVKQGTTTTYILVPTASVGLNFNPMASITLDSDLIFNIYIPAHTGLKSATLNGTPVALENAEGGYFLVSTELSAEEGAKTLTLVVTLDLDGTSVNGTFTFSTVKYVSKLLSTEGVTEAEKTLAKDMLAYVKSAYNYFDSADKATVADNIDAVIGNYSKTFAKVEGAGADADDIIAGVTFVLDSTPAIRFYLPEGASLNGYSFKIGNTALEIADSGIETAGDCAGLTYADISLYAYRMIETITIVNGANTATYHINEYYDGMDKSDTALVDIVEKFYNYCKSASEYRNSVMGK